MQPSGPGVPKQFKPTDKFILFTRHNFNDLVTDLDRVLTSITIEEAREWAAHIKKRLEERYQPKDGMVDYLAQRTDFLAGNSQTYVPDNARFK